MTKNHASIGHLLINAARIHKNRLALWLDEVEYSYQDLFNTACSLAREFQRDVPSGQAIGILCQHSFSAYVGVLASLLSGRPYLPVNPSEPYERQRLVLEIVRPAVLLCDDATIQSAAAHRDDLDYAPKVYLANGSESVLELPGRLVPTTLLDEFEVCTSAQDSAYILFTSGTTGTPKGVRILHRNVCAYLDAMREIIPLTPDDRCTQFFALSFDVSAHDFLIAWTSGASIWVQTGTAGFDRLDFVRTHQLTSWYSIPVMVANALQLGQLEPGSLPSLRYSAFIGEALPTSLALAWQQACPQSAVYNLYGPTEATISVTACRFDAAGPMTQSVTVPIGEAQLGQFAIVVDENGKPAFPDTEGELLLGGSQVSPGYINLPEQNATRFFEGEVGDSGIQRWYRTGDLVLNCSKNGLIFKGRMDSQLKIGGYRVEMEEVEDIIRRAAGTAEVAAAPFRPNGLGGADGIVAFVCKAKRSREEIIKICRQELPRQLVPRKIIELESLPTNKSGKIDRKELQKHIEVPKKSGLGG